MKETSPSSRIPARNLRTIVHKWRRLFVSRLAVQEKASAVILMYHSVNDPEHPAIVPFNIVSPDNFTRQMRCLAQRYHVVSLDMLVEELRSGQLPLGRTVALTFDDGYKDSLTHVFPALRQYGLAGTFFLPTGYIGSNKLKWDDCLSLLLATTPSQEIGVQIEGQKISWPLDGGGNRREAFLILFTRLRALDSDRRERILSRLISRYGCAERLNSGDIMLSWEDVKRMAEGGMTFGAHTVNHVSLANLGKDRIVREIAQSKQAIESHTGRSVTCFSYPFGKPGDLSPIARAVLQSAGFACAVTSQSGSIVPGSDLFALKRIVVGGEHDLLDWELQVLSE